MLVNEDYLMENYEMFKYITLNVLKTYSVKPDLMFEDVLQEAIVSLLKNNKYTEKGKILSYFKVIVTNIVRMRFRKKKEKLIDSTEIVNGEYIHGGNGLKNYTPPIVDDIEERCMSKDILNKLNLAKDSELYLFAIGYSYEEIAKIKKITIPAVKQKVFRQRRGARLFREVN